MIEVTIVSVDDKDAADLVAAYTQEINRRLRDDAPEPGAAWREKDYGGPRGRVLVARLDGVPVACAGLRERPPATAEITRFYVAPRARRRGVGRALLAKIERVARELGYRRVVLDVAALLVAAARLFETSGYARVAPFRDNAHETLWLEKAFPLDDDTLWNAFRNATLPHAEWTHRSHLRVAFLYLARWRLDEAHLRIRIGIVRLNARHGLEDTPERGYHETLTRAWLTLVAHAMTSGAFATSDAFLSAHAELLDGRRTLRFYSQARLMSVRARSIFVEPDIAPLPGSSS